MMGDSYCPFPERLSAQFTEIDSDVMMSLSESNPEYAALKAVSYTHLTLPTT